VLLRREEEQDSARSHSVPATGMLVLVRLRTYVIFPVRVLKTGTYACLPPAVLYLVLYCVLRVHHSKQGIN
jgi:hypothetical protein